MTQERARRGGAKDQKGERNNRAVLTEAQVREILALHDAHVPQAEIARRFRTTRGNVWAIVHGRSWVHLDPGKIPA
jgi:hypothetical protein